MKKLKQLSLILFLSVGLFSCEAEKADEELNNQFLQGQQIFRCEIDGETRVTNNVNVSINQSGFVTVTAIFNDQLTNFNSQVLTISFDDLIVGSYVSSLGQIIIVDETIGLSSASFKHHNVNWEYTTGNAFSYLTNPEAQVGVFDLSSINDKAKYFEASFEFDLYAPYNQNQNNLIAPVIIRNGYLQYIKY